MTDKPVALSNLYVVGYAEVLKENMLPSVVPPVFRTRNGKNFYLPPFHMYEGFLYGATKVLPKEAQDLERSREITLFGKSFRAESDYTLWLDISSAWHYEPRLLVKRHLTGLAVNYIQKAKDALRRGKLTDADLCCGVAASADDRRIEPFAIKGAICKFRENLVSEGVMEDLVRDSLGPEEFRVLVEYYLSLAGKQGKPRRR